jgi:dethiobiotin synthetase
MSAKIIFVTGTDTGVGKTLLTALLLQHLRLNGVRALAMKPFCSGGRADVNLLQSLQPGELSDAEMNPFYFPEPVAPLVSEKMRRKTIRLKEVLARIQSIKAKCETLLIEGSGGLLVPLGRGFTVADLIAQLDCQVVVAARNRLGTINHTLLTIGALREIGQVPRTVVLMGCAKADVSSRTNRETLTELLRPMRVFEVPFLGNNCLIPAAVKRNVGKVKNALNFVTQKT